VIGGLVALAVGWGSILVAVRLPVERWLRAQDLRRAGGASLTALGLLVLGVPIPTWGPLVVLVGGVMIGALRRCRGRVSERSTRPGPNKAIPTTVEGRSNRQTDTRGKRSEKEG
jgi:hypothetical protein